MALPRSFQAKVRAIVVIALMATALCQGAAHAAAPSNVALVKSVSVQEFPDKDQVVINGDMPLTYHEVKSPTQIIIDIPNAKFDSKGKVQLVLSKAVKLYRVMNLEGANPRTVRAIIVLNESLPTTVYKQNSQIIVDVDKSSIIDRMEKDIVAKDEADTTKKHSNTLVEYHYNQGKTFARLGKWNEAVDEYLKALKIDPANDKIKLSLDVAKNNLKSEKEIDKAVRQYQNGEYNEAVRSFTAITNMWPQDIAAHFHLGKSYLKLNKYREAMIEFEKVLEINPDYENVKELYELSKRRKTMNNFTVELRDQDILDVLRTILHGSGFNLVAEDGVKKRISIALVDKTLDEALNEVIIKNGFKYEKIDNTIKIMPNIPSPEDRVYSQMNLVDLEIGQGLEVLSRLMEKNVILDASIDKIKTNKVTLYIRDELTIKEIFELLLKTNDLVAIPYYENTYIIMTLEESRTNNKYSRKEYRLIKISNAKPSDMLNKIFASKVIADNINKDSISYDDDNFTIAIFDTVENIRLITSIIEQNDIKIKQVTIAVKMLEVTKTAKKALGLNLSNLDNSTTINSQTPFRLNVKNLGKISLTKLDAQLDLLENNDSVKTLASPITRVVDKEKATIQSGKDIPVKDVVQNPQYEGGKIVGYTSQETWTSAHIGIELGVTPSIHNDGEITLDVNVTQNDADLTNVQVGSHFVTTGKSTKTKLRVKDGETVVMGGLISTQDGGRSENLPFFNKIPLIGKLFQKTTDNRQRNELIIFLTAYLVNKDDEDAEKENKKISSDMLKFSLPPKN